MLRFSKISILKLLLSLSIFLGSFLEIKAQADTIVLFNSTTQYFGEVYYIGSVRVLYDKGNGENVELSIVDIRSINFMNTDSDLSKQWRKILEDRNKIPHYSEKVITAENIMKDTIILYKSSEPHIGEVFYIGQKRVIFDRGHGENVELSTVEINSINFENKSSELSKQWLKILEERKNSPSNFEITNTSINNRMDSFKDPHFINEDWSKFGQEIKSSSYFLKKSANNRRNIFLGGLITGVGIIGWNSNGFNNALVSQQDSKIFFFILGVGGSSFILTNYILSFTNLKKSAIHLEAASNSVGLSLIIPIIPKKD